MFGSAFKPMRFRNSAQEIYRKISQVSDPDLHTARICINLSCWIRIRIRILIQNADTDTGGQKWPTKKEKVKEISCFEVLDLLLGGLKDSPAGSWGVLYEGIRKSKLQFLINKFFSAVKMFLFLVIKTQDPGTGSGSPIRKKCRIRIKPIRIRNPR